MSIFTRFARPAAALLLLASSGCSSGSESTPGAGGPGSTAAPAPGADASTPDAATSRPATADSRFRPKTDGFSFPNYADEPGPGVFDASDLRRMYGDSVCKTIRNGTCELTPQGEDWVDKVNTSLQGGHCEGFAVMSLLFHKKWLDPTAFGAASTSALSLAGNGALNHELAYWYATQFLEDPVISTTHVFKASEAVNFLLDSLSAPTDDTVVRVGLARLGASGALEGGHAVTPYAVLEGDAPKTKKVMVYDSNHPGEERYIAVDLGKDSWSYTAGTTPDEPDSLYYGDPANKNRLYVAAVHPRLGVHACTFCDASNKGGVVQGPGPIEEVARRRSLLVHGSLEPLVVDANGHHLGRVNGVFVNEIPGAVVTPGFSGGLWADNTPTHILLPRDGDVKVSVTARTGAVGAAARPARAHVTLFGSGYSLGVEYPAGSTAAGDVIGMPNDAKGVTLTSATKSSASLTMAVQTAAGGMVARVAVADLPAGANVGLKTDGDTGKVDVKVESTAPVDLKMNVGIDKGDGAGKQVFEGAVTSKDGDAVGVDLAKWTGGTDPMPISVAPKDGSAPKVIVVDNKHDYTPPLVDECALNLSNCSPNATCTDTPSGFTCACKPGYGGDGVTCTAGLVVPPPPPPAVPSLSYTFPGAPALLFTVGKLAMLQPPANTGGPVDTYEITPALPPGLTFDSRTARISGTPTTVTAAADHTIRATNAGGTGTATLRITVQGPLPKISYGSGAQSLFRWEPAPPIVPTSTGGPVLEYTITPALPPGLTFDIATGAISGIPTALSPETSYTVTAFNASGPWPTALSLGVVCASGPSCDTPPGFTIGGTITGLRGTVVLGNNGGDDLTVSANGAFSFRSSLTRNASYAVSVLVPPTSPTQVCTVAKASGTVLGADVRDVTITCATSSFTVGGVITGLAGTVVLANNGANDLVVNSGGPFTFPLPVASGGDYAVTVRTQPSAPAQICTVTGGSGKVGAGNIATVSISCTTRSFTVGGSITGLVGVGLVLTNGGSDPVSIVPSSIPGATPFSFPAKVLSGNDYAVAIDTQPLGQTCSVSGATGKVGGGDVSSVVVNCATNAFTVGGTVSGLAGTLALQNNAGDTLTLSGGGSFAFPTPIAFGTPYAVTVLTQPSAPSQTCTVSGGSGTMGNGDVTNLVVSCTTNTFRVGGTVSGLAGTVVLQNNAGDDLVVSANGPFTFPTSLASGTSYSATVLTQPAFAPPTAVGPSFTPASPAQTCTVASAVGAVGAGNVTSIAVTCTTSTFTVGGNVFGVVAPFTLQESGGSDLVVNASGPFTFARRVASAAFYDVAVSSQPAIGACSVSLGNGLVSTANVTTVNVTCTGGSSNSCKSLLAANPSLPSGVYTLTGDATYQTYCDMTTAGGGWTLVMKLAAGDFCNDSLNWTNGQPLNEGYMVDTSFPGVGNYDAKSHAFYMVDDATSLRFDTTSGSVATDFVSPASAETLMTTNLVDFAVYPDRAAWRAAFGHDRNQAPIFMRAGVPVTNGNVCRNNPQATPVGCGQTCMFCYQASDGDCCGCDANFNDTSSGMGNGAAYCGGGLSNCSTGGSWSNPQNQVLVWAR